MSPDNDGAVLVWSDHGRGCFGKKIFCEGGRSKAHNEGGGGASREQNSFHEVPGRSSFWFADHQRQASGLHRNRVANVAAIGIVPWNPKNHPTAAMLAISKAIAAGPSSFRRKRAAIEAI